MIRSWAVPGLAVGGVLLGHAITYAGLAPGAIAREMLLAATGHTYLGAANRLGALAAVVTLAALVLGRVVGRRGGDLSPGEVARRLVVFQLAAFTAIEVAERLGADAPLSSMATALPAGLVIQAVVAVSLAALVRWLLRAADRVATLSGKAPDAPTSASITSIPAAAWYRPAIVPATVGGRAPPRAR